MTQLRAGRYDAYYEKLANADLSPNEKLVSEVLQKVGRPLTKLELEVEFGRAECAMNDFDVRVAVRELVEKKKISFDEKNRIFLKK